MTGLAQGRATGLVKAAHASGQSNGHEMTNLALGMTFACALGVCYAFSSWHACNSRAPHFHLENEA